MQKEAAGALAHGGGWGATDACAGAQVHLHCVDGGRSHAAHEARQSASAAPIAR